MITDPVTRQPFANNRIPSDRIDPNATTFLGFTPAANRNSSVLGSNNFVTSSVTTRTTEDQYVGRLNYNMSAGDMFSARYIYDKLTTPNDPPIFGNDENINTATAQNAAASWTHTVSPTFVTQVLAGWNHFVEHQVFGTTNKPEYDIACGLMRLPMVACDPFNYGRRTFRPVIRFLECVTDGPRDRMNRRWSVDVNNSVQVGRHLLNFGGSVDRLTWTFDQVGTPRGVYRFDGAQTAPAGTAPTAAHQFADFLLGSARALTLSPTPLNVHEDSWNTHGYFQEISGSPTT